MLIGAVPAVSDFFSSNFWFSLIVILITLLISILLSKIIPEKHTINSGQNEYID